MAAVASVMRGLALGLLLLLVAQSLPASAQSQVQIGIDVVSDGSGQANSNSVDACTPVSSGDSIHIDIYIRNVTDLIAWEAYLHFEEDKLAFVSADPKLFLQNEPGSKLLTLSEALPRGRHFIGAADSSAATESGSGVLARVTLKATASGLARVDLPTQDVDGDGQFEIGPILTTTGGSHPGDTNGDGVFDGPLAPALIAIDTSCSGAPTPGPDQGSDDQPPEPTTPTSGGGDSSSDDGDGSDDDGDGSVGDSVLGAASDGDSDGETSADDPDAATGGSSNGGGDDSGAAQDSSSGGLSDTLVIAIAVAGAAIVVGFVMFSLGRWRRRPN